jgi:hypothetical protein
MRTRECPAFCLGLLHDDDKSASAVSAYASKRGSKWYIIDDEDVAGAGKDDGEQDE